MRETNNKSIVSLTLGILSIILPYIGLILGIIGFVLSFKSIGEINRLKQKGKGLAISGRVCSLIGICMQIVIILLGVLAYESLLIIGS
ncbi:DUF4190 domain-containing protein [Metabacillus niabensis]|uniref:DUF4190 domain-containing protein n=1 Tax=Metabacillus TaxID=2675233 RepID=UPI000BA52AC7|nr:hypothetical protein CHH83_14665 [Bacillus sp. 7586-K]